MRLHTRILRCAQNDTRFVRLDYMKRIKIAELLRTEPVGTEVTVKGWVKGFRNNQFIALNDGSTANNIQVVVDFENMDDYTLSRIKFGAAIAATGLLIASQGKGQKVEIKATKINVYGDYPNVENPDYKEFKLQPKKQSLEFLRENAHLRFRTNTFSAVFRIRHNLAFAIHKFFNDRGFYYLHTPIITGSDAEGAGEMFKVTTLDLTNVHYTSDSFDNACTEYWDALKDFIDTNHLSGIKNQIDDYLIHLDKDLNLEKLINLKYSEIVILRDIRGIGKHTPIELRNLFDELWSRLIEKGFFNKTIKEGKEIIHLPDWVTQLVNRSTTKRSATNKDISKAKIFSLSFYNYAFIVKELTSTKDRKTDHKNDFFHKPTNLTVSGQLEGELAAMALGEIYTFGPTFRAEKSNTTRHLAEFWMIEPEVAFANLEDNMNLAEDMLKYVIKYALAHCSDDLKILEERLIEEEKEKSQDQRSEMKLIEKLHFVIDNEFERLTYTDAIAILRNSTPYKKGKFKYPIQEWNTDLQSEHEKYLVEKHFKKPVILINYPAGIKAFYMRLNDGCEDGRETVAAMDILFPGIGEIIGGSQREERFYNLVKRMDDMGVPKGELDWYLDTRRFGSCPHAGFGLGFERLMLFVTGMTNIRDVIAFPRYPGSAEF